MRNQTPRLSWRNTPQGDVPVSDRFDDPYYSLDNGLAETRHVFLEGNDLPARFTPGFVIGELGFGTGLNALAAVDLWRRAGMKGRLQFTSFEAFPMAADDMQKALAAWPELGADAEFLVECWARGQRRAAFDCADLEVIEGDARTTLPAWRGAADAWFLDGFSPARNPEMWEPSLLAEVARHARAGATLATYSAAGHVRRALADAGFGVTRTSGFRGKRHMTRGRL